MNLFLSLLYILVCVLAGLILVSKDVTVKDWQYWVIMACVMVAYLSGRYNQ